jgi:ParB-like chromosome segregation protein Spo0J
VIAQLQLLPSSPPSQRLERVELERLDGFADAKPSRELREQLRTLGLLQAIVAVPARDGRFRIVDGRRRAKAIAELAEKGEWPERPVVDVLILEGADTERQAVRAGLTLAVHASRGASPASELAAIEAIIEAGRPGGEAATTKQIAAQTGMSLQTIRRRLRLRSLTPGLRRALDEGRLPASVAEAAARLPAARQEDLERALEDVGHLTLAVVRDVTREQTSTSTGELPDGLFAEQEAPWQVTVRGHVTAALAAIPRGDQHAPLARKLTELLAFASRL